LEDGSKSTDEKNVPKPARNNKKAGKSSQKSDETKVVERKPLKKADLK